MNKLEKPPQNDVAAPKARHKTTQVMVGNVAVGGGAPITVHTNPHIHAGTIVQDIFRTLRSLNRDGLAIFLVEQNVRQALAIADAGYVLERGAIVVSACVACSLTVGLLFLLNGI